MGSVLPKAESLELGSIGEVMLRQVDEGRFDVHLINRPLMRGDESKNNPNGTHASLRSKGVDEVNARPLGISFGH